MNMVNMAREKCPCEAMECVFAQGGGCYSVLDNGKRIAIFSRKEDAVLFRHMICMSESGGLNYGENKLN